MAYIGQKEEIREYQGRYLYLKLIVGIAFLILFARIWYLQILNGAKFYTYSKDNSLKQEKIPASRGMIFDRNREILVDNYPAFDVTWTPQFVVNSDKTAECLFPLIQMKKEEILDIVAAETRNPRFQPRVIKQDISKDEVAKIEAHRFDMPGVDVQVAIKRNYTDGAVGAHLLGYMGEISDDELDNLNRRSFQKYDLGDFVGKFGIEERWEDYLRGIDGAYFSEVDAFGRKKSSRELTLFDYEQTKKEPIPGKNLVLTIDRELQLAASKALLNKKGGVKTGALVALDPNTGEVLAMISQPGFDPSAFSRGINPKQWAEFISNPEKPLLDKTIQDAYPPGSTFKLITALTGLANHAVDFNETVNCNGHFFLGRAHFRCWTWRNGGHHIVNLKRAIRESCDYFFYRLGIKVGVDELAKYAKMYGLGQRTGLNLRGEVSGNMPSEAWKRKKYGERWFPGETPSVSIGQGYTTVSVVQLARLYMAVANGGTLYVPYVVKRIEEPDGTLIQEINPQIVQTEKFDPEIWKHLKDGLYAVVNEPGGTAYFSGRIDGLDIAGKTGTSQVVKMSKDKDKKCEQVEYKYKDHAWFVGFAPVDKPQIVVAALALHDCHPYNGATMAVRDVIKAYLKNRIDPTVLRFKLKKTSSTPKGMP